MNKHWENLLIALVLALITAFIVVTAGKISAPGTTMNRILQIMGSGLPSGVVQFFTFLLFYFGLAEIYSASKKVGDEEFAYSLHLLPEREQYVLSPRDVNDIKLDVMKKEDGYRKYVLTELIKKACTKYRANKSTSEALEIVTATVRINMANSESEQSMIRYVAWAIPSVGFIGTIIGIAGSLGTVKANMGEDDIALVTQALYVAFDTTLLSLVLSIVLMFVFHVTQEKIEKFHANMESYVIENLINRIYKN